MVANKLSMRVPREYRRILGIWRSPSCQQTYASTNLSATPDNLGRPGGGDSGFISGKYTIPTFEEFCSFEYMFSSWREFRRGKKHKPDVAEFACDLIGQVSRLREDLLSGRYRHGGYVHFRVSDPKPRDIHKASVRDRVAHHMVYRALYPYVDRRFIYDAYSCREGKGTHRALRRFADMGRRVGRNNTRTVWVLSCDIRKCFASIDHGILTILLHRYVPCPRMRRVLDHIIDSFVPGIPLGNLTSQIFVNVYLHELDRHMKHILRAYYYVRYADDMVVLSHDRSWLDELVPRIACFLQERLRLELHPCKLTVRTLASGVDFLGWVHFSDHRVLRSTTRRRMIASLERGADASTIASYRGLLKHGNARSLRAMLEY